MWKKKLLIDDEMSVSLKTIELQSSVEADLKSVDAIDFEQSDEEC